MPVALCIKCGRWKQSPTQKCACGFEPARGSVDEARSFVLTEQFRSRQQLEAAAQALQAGGSVHYKEEELARSKSIGSSNAGVNFAFLCFAVLLGLLIGAGLAGLSMLLLVTIGVLAITALATALALLGRVERRVGR